MKGLTNLLSHETAGMFGVSSGALYLMWSQGAPESLLWMVTLLAAVYIAGEKVRSTIRGDD